MSIIEKALNKIERGEGRPRRRDPIPNQKEPDERASHATQSARPERDRPDMTAAAGKRDESVARHERNKFESEVNRSEAAARKRSETAPRLPSRRSVHLDYPALNSAGFVTPEATGSRVAEQFRIIKRQLLVKAAATEHGNVILVTSSLASEGKTYVSTNLAISLAMEMNRTVLLVDGDIPKPDTCHVLGIDAQDGLLDLLSRPGTSISDVLINTDMPRLAILPAGHSHPHGPELLASDAMANILHKLGHDYPNRVIIFDSAPLLADSAASILAGLAGQVVMVVEAVRTPQSAIKEALALLGRTDNVSLILNKSRESRSTQYGYGFYGSQGQYGYHAD